MLYVIAVSVIGLAACAALVVWHACRTALELPLSADDREFRSKTAPMDGFQGGVKLDTRTDYATDDAATRRVMEKLHREEIHQRPQEGRN